MGRKIPAGSAVMAPTWFIHHDPDLWPEPFKFDPERFSPENRSQHTSKIKTMQVLSLKTILEPSVRIEIFLHLFMSYKTPTADHQFKD
jgi:hypothetical protein